VRDLRRGSFPRHTARTWSRHRHFTDPPIHSVIIPLCPTLVSLPLLPLLHHPRDSIDAIYKALTRSQTHPMGGNAYLSLEDESDPFSGGLKYVAMPPTKRFRDMEQLSGGDLAGWGYGGRSEGGRGGAEGRGQQGGNRRVQGDMEQLSDGGLRAGVRERGRVGDGANRVR
jgi:hypothetical protein